MNSETVLANIGWFDVEQWRSAADLVQQTAKLLTDPTLASALSPTGLRVGDSVITSLAATKLTGDIAAARMQANVITAVNNSTGDIAAARMQANIIAAINNSSGGGDFSRFNTGNINNGIGSVTTASLTTSGSGNIGGALTVGGTLDHDGSTVGFYGVTPVSRQLVTSLTDNLRNAGTDDVIADYDPAAAYGDVASIIQGNIKQLARKVAQIEAANRTLGLTRNS